MLKTVMFVLTNTLKYLLANSPRHRKILNDLCLHDTYDLVQLRTVQKEMLLKIVRHAYKHCEYYKTSFHNVGITPGNIAGILDLHKIPVLTKNDVRAHFDKIISDNKPVIVNREYTSGTTGTPLKVIRDLSSIIYEGAAISRIFKWAGYEDGDRIAYVRGNKCDLNYFDALSKSLYVNASTLANRLGEICSQLVRYRISFIFCVSSTAEMLSNYVMNSGIQSIKLKGIITSSEMLAPQTRNKVKAAFQCNVFDYYGNTERVAMIANCGKSEYHLMLDYGAENLKHIGGNYYEIISTNLFNYAMPLINYQTGDVIEMDAQPSRCGMRHPVVKSIIGRESDYVNLNGNKVYNTTLTNVFSGIKDNNIQKCQFIQDENGDLHLHMHLSDISDLKSVNHIQQNFLEWFRYADLKIELDSVFVVLASGKEPFIVNRMAKESDQ